LSQLSHAVQLSQLRTQGQPFVVMEEYEGYMYCNFLVKSMAM